ncbi:unnamed protein product [Amoebophrya sp. A120]|nr:unnamed protein product [Amoebophrya sp. A120]|eukprot:GSA120T00020294001.1
MFRTFFVLSVFPVALEGSEFRADSPVFDSSGIGIVVPDVIDHKDCPNPLDPVYGVPAGFVPRPGHTGSSSSSSAPCAASGADIFRSAKQESRSSGRSAQDFLPNPEQKFVAVRTVGGREIDRLRTDGVLTHTDFARIEKILGIDRTRNRVKLIGLGSTATATTPGRPLASAVARGTADPHAPSRHRANSSSPPRKKNGRNKMTSRHRSPSAGSARGRRQRAEQANREVADLELEVGQRVPETLQSIQAVVTARYRTALDNLHELLFAEKSQFLLARLRTTMEEDEEANKQLLANKLLELLVTTDETGDLVLPLDNDNTLTLEDLEHKIAGPSGVLSDVSRAGSWGPDWMQFDPRTSDADKLLQVRSHGGILEMHAVLHDWRGVFIQDTTCSSYARNAEGAEAQDEEVEAAAICAASSARPPSGQMIAATGNQKADDGAARRAREEVPRREFDIEYTFKRAAGGVDAANPGAVAGPLSDGVRRSPRVGRRKGHDDDDVLTGLILARKSVQWNYLDGREHDEPEDMYSFAVDGFENTNNGAKVQIRLRGLVSHDRDESDSDDGAQAGPQNFEFQIEVTRADGDIYSLRVMEAQADVPVPTGGQ